MEKQEFKTSLFGYDKEQVDKAFEKMQADMDSLVEDSKAKIKQAQSIAMQSNALVDDLKKQMEKIKAELKALKKKS